jgi:hypothetical protein
MNKSMPIRWAGAFAVLVLLAGWAGQARPEMNFRLGDALTPRQCQPADSPSRGRLEFCLLAGADGRAIMPAVFAVAARGERREIWRDWDRGFLPWKLLVAELDGDAEPEIALGVWKRTRFDPEKRNRLFIYDWTGGCLHAKWLGSRLVAPFSDFKFARPDAEARIDSLYALETEGGRRLVRKYHWNGFGFSSERIIAGAERENEGQVLLTFQRIGE